MSYVENSLSIEEGKIIFRNFSGKESKYNREGDRNFCVLIDDSNVAKQLMEDGWNVRMLESRDEDEDVKYYIQVAVSFGNIPPNIYLVSGNAVKTKLSEETVASLDWADIINADIIIRPYNWEVNGKSGVKGYLKTLYVTIQQDEFAHKYSEVGCDMDEDDQPF